MAKPSVSELWLRPCGRVPLAPRLRLVCFPHAGGTAQAFRSWPERLPPGTGMFAVQYPGRQDRFSEPLIDDIDGLTGPLVAALEPFVGEPLVLLGHSMGAFVAYETTVELERRHGRVVDQLVVSGVCPPHRKPPHQVHRQSDEALVADVRRVNASFADLLANPELMRVLLPMIRADYRLSETYRRDEPVPVEARLLAAGGIEDSEVGRQGLLAWSSCAAGHFEVLVQPGGHFYLFDDADAFTASLAERLPGGALWSPAG
ncbi:thioesterase II family protein [Streptomyces ziwulingensis]